MINEPAGAVQVTVIDDRGKLDINQSPPALLAALFSVVGADKATAHLVSDGIADWRSQQPIGSDTDTPIVASYKADGRAWGPAGQEFQRLDELKMVNRHDAGALCGERALSHAGAGTGGHGRNMPAHRCWLPSSAPGGMAA